MQVAKVAFGRLQDGLRVLVPALSGQDCSPTVCLGGGELGGLTARITRPKEQASRVVTCHNAEIWKA